MLKFGSLFLNSNVIQSPMAGCTDLPFRLIGREHGMELAFLEMISADALIRGTEETRELMRRSPDEKPLGAQLVGCNADAMAEGAKIIEDMGFDILDLNLGCPVPKVTGKGSGSALLTRPDDVKEIFEKVAKAVTKIPVTAKMRVGYDDASGEEAVRIAKIAEDSGFSAVCVHGRTRAQRYTNPIHLDAIRKVKEAVKIPVTGNGNVFTEVDAIKMRNETGCDGIVLGRGALGNPLVYKRIDAAIQGKPLPPKPELSEIKQTLLKHFKLEIEHNGERVGVLQMRKVACWYFNGLPGVAVFRTKINTCLSVSDMRHLIEDFDDQLNGCPSVISK